MAFDFPSSPVNGQTFSPVAGLTYVYNGYGWDLQTPGLVAGDRTLISAVTVTSAVATVDFTSGIDATYDQYEIHVYNWKGVSDAALQMRVSIDGGATWITTASYNWAFRYTGAAGTPADSQNASQTQMQLTLAQLSAANTAPTHGIIRFANPSDSTQHQIFLFDFGGHHTTLSYFRIIGEAGYIGVAAINGIRFLPNAGNHAQGTFVLYGVNKSGAQNPAGVIRYDAPQALTTPQQAVALSNISAAQNVLINGVLVESRAANAATYSIKTLAGADPSAGDPVLVRFKDGSTLAITSAVALTIPSTATLGTVSGLAFRLWFMIVVSGGTAYLAVRQNYLVSSGVAFLLWHAPVNVIGTNAISTAAASRANYATAAVSGPFRVIGYADYDSGLATAGAWAAAPTRIVHADDQTPMPGTVLQLQQYGTATQLALPDGGGVGLSALALNIGLLSPANIVRCQVVGDIYANCTVGAENVSTRIWRNDASQIGYQRNMFAYAGSQSSGGYAFDILDRPNTTAGTLYRLVGSKSPGTAGDACYLPWTGCEMQLSEIMI